MKSTSWDPEINGFLRSVILAFSVLGVYGAVNLYDHLPPYLSPSYSPDLDEKTSRYDPEAVEYMRKKEQVGRRAVVSAPVAAGLTWAGLLGAGGALYRLMKRTGRL
jgi:hypothetical protein